MQFKLKEGATFKRFHPRRVPPKHWDALKKEIDALLELGIIYPVESPMASPLVLVKKGEGIRMCIDYKIWVNTILEELRFPLPYIADILTRLSGLHFFFKMDLPRGFHQLRISPDSQYLTSFICPWGTFAFTRLPFGISLAPMYFRRLFRTSCRLCLTTYVVI